MSNYRLPAEWEQQSAVWTAWPHNKQTWPANRQLVKERMAALNALLSTSVQTNVICDVKFQDEAREMIHNSPGAAVEKISFFDIYTDDVWCRDFGPLVTLKNDGQKLITNWQFNAWGGKYPCDNDNMAAGRIAKLTDIPQREFDLILEGGAIEVNGKGTLITTEDVLLNSNRNPDISKEDYEKAFSHLGINQIIWLKKGLLNDDTDGHIDNICRFVNENTVATASCPVNNPNYERLRKNRKILESSLINGQPLNIIDLPMPDKITHNGSELPASYLNFLITNGTAIVPAFGQEADFTALQTIQKLFPDRKAVSFDCCDFLQEGGAVHCLTMNQS